ncbi:MAG: PASTA domain-containing protein [Candidatus Marinimicrobia bacterium]|nr:PASTA domain-containing protein [Candidatus Neomarinimicrobiota bacterium]
MKPLLHYLIAIGVIMAAGLLLLETVIMPMYVRADQKHVLANVRHRPLYQARRILISEGFKAIVEDTIYSNYAAPNTVVDQYPEPGKMVKPGRTVRLKISQPEKLVSVPKLIGHTVRSAELLLQQIGLVVDTVYTEYNPNYPKGTIAWQSPKGGDMLKKGFGIHMTVSKGMPPNFFQIPNLFGLSMDNAEKHLKKAGLTLGRVEYRQNEDLIPYTVLSQSIEAETVLDRSMPIDITVSVLDMQDVFDEMMGRD